jgi:hypothetical protein
MVPIPREIFSVSLFVTNRRMLIGSRCNVGRRADHFPRIFGASGNNRSHIAAAENSRSGFPRTQGSCQLKKMEMESRSFQNYQSGKFNFLQHYISLSRHFSVAYDIRHFNLIAEIELQGDRLAAMGFIGHQVLMMFVWTLRRSTSSELRGGSSMIRFLHVFPCKRSSTDAATCNHCSSSRFPFTCRTEQIISPGQFCLDT